MSAYMDNVLSVLVPSFSHAQNVKEVSNSLDIYEQHHLLGIKKSGGLQEIISHVHNSLSSTKERLRGLLILDQLVRDCSTEVFLQNVQTWLKLLLQTLQSYNTAVVHRLACLVCCQVLDAASKFSELAREVTTSVIPQLIPALLNASTEWREAALSCINCCIQKYGGAAGPFKNKIETVVVKELQKPDPSKECVMCYALLARCGSGGNQGIKHTEGWSLQCQKLLCTMVDVLDLLYEGVETEKSSGIEGQMLYLGAVPDNYQERVTSLVSRWQTICRCLEALLREEFPAVAKVPVDTVLNIICRCLAINGKMLLSRPTSDRSYLAAHLPAIHAQAFKLLDRLIQCCRSTLLLHVQVVNSLFVQELLWTSIIDMAIQDKPFRWLRQCVYETLTVWLKCLDSSACVTLEEKSLVKELLLDATPHTEVIQIQMSTSGNSKSEAPSGKKKKRGYQEMSRGISSQKKSAGKANSQLVAAALEALYWILTSSGSELGRKILQDIQQFTVSTVLSVQRSCTPPVPYTCHLCRKHLYRLLMACTMTPHSAAPPPIQFAVGLFRQGLQDIDLEVSSYCTEATRICEIMIHPRVPCLNGPVVCDSLIRINNGTVHQICAEQEVNEQSLNLGISPNQIPANISSQTQSVTVTNQMSSFSSNLTDTKSLQNEEEIELTAQSNIFPKETEKSSTKRKAESEMEHESLNKTSRFEPVPGCSKESLTGGESSSHDGFVGECRKGKEKQFQTFGAGDTGAIQIDSDSGSNGSESQSNEIANKDSDSDVMEVEGGDNDVICVEDSNSKGAGQLYATEEKVTNGEPEVAVADSRTETVVTVEEDSEENKASKKTSAVQEEVETMLLSFVNAAPDSD